jgi:nicotinate phosphoribosyltransferase
MMREQAPIEGFGIGVNLAASIDAPSLDCAYKLQEFKGRPRRKRSEGKETWPGRKQVFRTYDAQGRMARDIVTVETEAHDGDALVVPVMRGGKRLPQPSLEETRAHAAQQLAMLPQALARLQPGASYPVTIAQPLHDLADEADRLSSQ